MAIPTYSHARVLKITKWLLFWGQIHLSRVIVLAEKPRSFSRKNEDKKGDTGEFEPRHSHLQGSGVTHSLTGAPTKAF